MRFLNILRNFAVHSVQFALIFMTQNRNFLKHTLSGLRIR